MAKKVDILEMLQLKYGSDKIQSPPLKTCCVCKGKGEYKHNNKKLVRCICVLVSCEEDIRIELTTLWGTTVKNMAGANKFIQSRRENPKFTEVEVLKNEPVENTGRFVKGNRIAVSNNSGAAPLFGTPEEMAKKADEYFIYINGEYTDISTDIDVFDKKGNYVKTTTKVERHYERPPEPPTLTGLVLYLGFSGRKQLGMYEMKPLFKECIATIRTRIEYEYEKRLHTQAVVGAIFALKQMGWDDNQQTDEEGYVPPANPTFAITPAPKKLGRSEDDVRKAIEDEE